MKPSPDPPNSRCADTLGVPSDVREFCPSLGELFAEFVPHLVRQRFRDAGPLEQGKEEGVGVPDAGMRDQSVGQPIQAQHLPKPARSDGRRGRILVEEAYCALPEHLDLLDGFSRCQSAIRGERPIQLGGAVPEGVGLVPEPRHADRQQLQKELDEVANELVGAIETLSREAGAQDLEPSLTERRGAVLKPGREIECVQRLRGRKEERQ